MFNWLKKVKIEPLSIIVDGKRYYSKEKDKGCSHCNGFIKHNEESYSKTQLTRMKIYNLSKIDSYSEHYGSYENIGGRKTIWFSPFDTSNKGLVRRVMFPSVSNEFWNEWTYRSRELVGLNSFNDDYERYPHFNEVFYEIITDFKRRKFLPLNRIVKFEVGYIPNNMMNRLNDERLIRIGNYTLNDEGQNDGVDVFPNGTLTDRHRQIIKMGVQ
jgi:hypothetical protein|tara:strand:+ start:254 stop:895 length:642 start_codon:yes stop_codon:yes gene_type:complete